jgi:hypothetical protein
LRARPGAESFAAAWDAALGGEVRKVTPPARDLLECNPLVRLVMFRGRYRGSWHNAANGALVSRVRRPGGDASGRQVSPRW